MAFGRGRGIRVSEAFEAAVLVRLGLLMRGQVEILNLLHESCGNDPRLSELAARVKAKTAELERAIDGAIEESSQPPPKGGSTPED